MQFEGEKQMQTEQKGQQITNIINNNNINNFIINDPKAVAGLIQNNDIQ